MGFLVILPLAAAIALKFDKKIEETIAPAILLTIGIVYIFGLFTTLAAGGYCSLIVAGICIIYAAVVAQKNTTYVKEHICTAGLVAYGLYAVYFAAVVYGRGLTANDEFTHWALSVKNSLYFSHFSNITESTDINGTYTPAMAVWQFYGVWLWPKFSEAVCMHAFDMLMISLILPVFRIISGKWKVLKMLSQMLVYLVIPFIVYTGATHTVAYGLLLVDTVLGMLSAYILYMFYLAYSEEDSFYIYGASLAAGVLCLTKEFGVVLTIIDVVIIIICRYILARKYGKVATVSAAGPVIGFAAGALLSWYGYLAAYAKHQTMDTAGLGEKCAGYIMSSRPIITICTLASSGHMGVMLSGLFGQGDFEGKSLSATADAIIQQLSSISYYHIGYILPISFTTFVVLVVIFWMWHKDNSEKNNLKMLISNIIIPLQLIGCIPYLILLGFSYFILFAPWETIYLPSFDRYILPCIITIIIYIVNILYEEYPGKNGKKYIMILIAALLIGNPKYMVTSVLEKPAKTQFYGIQQDETQFNSGDNVYFVDQNVQEDYHRYKKEFYYYAFPARSNIGDDSTVVLQKAGTDQESLSADEWADTLKQYQYVYLYHKNASFINKYGKLFADTNKIKDYSLYKIERKNDAVVLEKVTN